MATPVLPLAVGPIRNTTGALGKFMAATLLAAHEKLIQLVDTERCPGGAAMITLAAAFSDFHVAQQSIHLGNAESAVGAHGPMTGHAGKNLVDVMTDPLTAAVLQHIAQNVPHQLLNIAAVQQRRDLPYHDGFRSDALKL